MPDEPQEPSMQIRMLLAFVLVFGVIFATPYFYRMIAPPAPPKKTVVEAPKKPVAETPAGVTPAGVTPAAVTPAPAPAAAPVSGAEVAAKEETTVIDTALYHIILTNRGAAVRSWTLKNYKDAQGKPLELVNQAAVAKVGYPFSYHFRDKKPPVDLNQALFVVKPGANDLSVTFEFSSGSTVAHKSFEFQKGNYVSNVSSEVDLNGAPLLHELAWRGGFADLAAVNAASQQAAIRYDSNESKVIRQGAKAAKDGPANEDSAYAFAGLEDQYFTMVFLPRGNGTLDTTTFSDTVPSPFDHEEVPFVGIAAGAPGHAVFSVYVGPKDIDTLRKVDPKLEQIVDFGWFGVIAKPLFLALQFLNNHYVHNYGWSIVLITVIINILLFPLKLTNMKSMKKMQALQPQIQAINEKYKNIPLRDPRQQQKNQETMDLYKKHGANPVGGCIPLLIQMPFLLAFYKVLTVSIELRNASWFWVHDLSQPETIAIRVLPVLLVVTGFIMQKMTPTTGGDPAQQKMMQFMPLMMGFFFWKAQSGLVLYWLTGNLVGIAQQWFFNKTMTPAEANPVPVKAPPKKGVRR